jgi:hypothetical protein
VVPHWHYRTWGQQRGRSRNKVAVGEPAAGSPPLRRGRTICVKGVPIKCICINDHRTKSVVNAVPSYQLGMKDLVNVSLR